MTPYLILRYVLKTVPYNFSTQQHLVHPINRYHSKGFGNSQTKFGVLSSMHVWVMTVSNLGCSDLDVGACIF